MARSHKARRKERQKERELVQEAVGRAQTSRQHPVIQTGQVMLAALAVAVASVLLVTRISDVSGSSGGRSSVGVEKEVSALLSGIQQNGDTLGQASAPITLEVFGDLESADARTFVLWLLPDIIRQWVRTNVVKIRYRSFMTASLPYPNVFVNQQAAALAAGVQNRLWNFIETFYHEQGKEDTRYVTAAYINGIARQIPGLELSEWENDRENSQLAVRVVDDDRAAQVGFPDGPVFLIGRTGGKLTPWPGYRLYEDPGLKPGLIKLPLHPVSFVTSHILKTTIEHLS